MRTRIMALVVVGTVFAGGLMAGCGPKVEPDPSNPNIQAPEGLTPSQPGGGASTAPNAPTSRGSDVERKSSL